MLADRFDFEQQKKSTYMIQLNSSISKLYKVIIIALNVRYNSHFCLYLNANFSSSRKNVNHILNTSTQSCTTIK